MSNILDSPQLRAKLKEHADVSDRDADDVFRMLDIIGRGSFGTVVLVEHIKKKKNYAIKVIDFSRDLSEKELENELHEIDILRQSKSPYIVKFYGIYEKDKALLIAMEFCGGGSVHDVLHYCNITFTEAQVAACTYCILKGLQHLHEKNITHRDIKAANILLTQSGTAKITDFGVSKIQKKGQKMQTTVGSPFWMAPEVIRMGTYDNNADIWSLGITCIEMAEGQPPRHDIHPMKVIREIPLKDPPTLADHSRWSPEFIEFITIALDKDPQKRRGASELLKAPGSKKAYKKELKALVKETIVTMTTEKRKAKEDENAAANMQSVLKTSGFLTLGPGGSVNTYTKEEGTSIFNYEGGDGTFIINGSIKDTETDGTDDLLEHNSGTFVLHE